MPWLTPGVNMEPCEKMRPNKLRTLLEAREPTVGTHIHSTWPSIVEIVGHTGMFDYVEFVAEYAPFDLYVLENVCRAAELHGLSTMIKVDQEPQRFLAQRAIGSGFQSVLFADCRSTAEARECVRAVRADTPASGGLYGVATRRNAYVGYGGSPDYVQALDDVVVALMIEKQGAVDHLEEILSISGVDMIQWGPADYCLSIGRPGDWYHPEVKAVERRVIETALKMGVIPRAEIGSPEQAQYYLDLGVRHFCIATDILILYNWLKENGEKLRKVISDA
jgi:4-hydroxy-2-oxoheptanedioate aldolase